jgi:hypothetical protein
MELRVEIGMSWKKESIIMCRLFMSHRNRGGSAAGVRADSDVGVGTGQKPGSYHDSHMTGSSIEGET